MESVLKYVYIAVIVLLSLSFHECAHGYVSYRLGDPTAKNAGRLTLNPLKHLDILGSIMMVATMLMGSGFGWAKPVPINPMYYKNKKAGTMLVSIAGPLSNLLLAFLSAFPLLYLQLKYADASLYATDYRVMLFTFLSMFFYANINLAVFNLLPVPPLDGSKIFAGILPTKQYYKFLQYERYVGIVFLLVIFVFPNQFSAVMNAVSGPVRYLLLTAAQPLVRLFI